MLENKKTMKHESDGVTSCNWCTRYGHNRIGTGIGRLRNKKTMRDHPDNSIVNIDQNTEKSPAVLRRLAVAQTPVRSHQLMPVWKTLKIIIIIMYMQNPAYNLENVQDKLQWDFNIETDHLISASRPDLIITNNKKRELAKLWTLLSWLTTE